MEIAGEEANAFGFGVPGLGSAVVALLVILVRLVGPVILEMDLLPIRRLFLVLGVKMGEFLLVMRRMGIIVLFLAILAFRFFAVW
jgi:hypothetical protein